MRPLTKITLTGLFAALAVALNYALIAIPQVKLFNLVIFSAGYFAGMRAGALAGGVAAAIYSIFNPYNLGMFPPLPLLATQVIAMSAIGAVGGYGKESGFFEAKKSMQMLKAGAVGLILSVFYNIVVTASGAYLFGTFKEAFIVAIPAMLLNVASNVVVFVFLFPLIIPLEKKL